MPGFTRHSCSIRRAIVSATVVGFVLALWLAASPESHEHLHHEDEESGHHQCLATMLHGGGCEDACHAHAVTNCIVTLREVVAINRSRAACSLYLSYRILEHAPPTRA